MFSQCVYSVPSFSTYNFEYVQVKYVALGIDVCVRAWLSVSIFSSDPLGLIQLTEYKDKVWPHTTLRKDHLNLKVGGGHVGVLKRNMIEV